LGFLGPPPLVDGEIPETYDELVARVTGALNPTDLLEDMWVRDIVDLIWDQLRLRHYKTCLLTSCGRRGVHHKLLETLPDQSVNEVGEMERKWAVHDDTARATVKATLASTGHSVTGLTARMMAREIGEFERIERLIRDAERRRHTALHELERHREGRAQRLRNKLANVEDAEFQVIARKGATPKGAT
jgi:hypothetical protein